jgi:5-methylcytosine-specific restriction endonuclease McrA
MDSPQRDAAGLRASNCCEYCRRRQVDSPLIPLQIEHVIPRKHGGGDSLDNLRVRMATTIGDRPA